MSPAHNGLVGGSNPPGPTTPSAAQRDFWVWFERPVFGGAVRGGIVSATRRSAHHTDDFIGGLASVAGGGKFENGAVTAAFGYL